MNKKGGRKREGWRRKKSKYMIGGTVFDDPEGIG